MHLGDAILHAFLDNELAEPERARAAEHLRTCAECRARLSAVQARAARVGQHLARLDPPRADAPGSPSLAFARFYARRLAASEKERFTMKSLLSRRFRPVWLGLAALLIVAFAFSFQPVQVWAGQFLGLFRVQQVSVLPIDMTSLTQLGTNQAVGKQVAQMFSKSLTVTKEPAAPQVVANGAAATKLAGFNVRLPASRSDAPQLTVRGGGAFQFVIDRTRAQAVLDQTGHSNLHLPASLDGATIKVTVPNSVEAGYGDCPTSQAESPTTVKGAMNQAQQARPSGSAGRRFADCVLLVEMPSPSIETPPNLNVEQLAEIGLQFTGMSAQQAHEYATTVDWTSTLVIPVPINAATYKQVTVDGVTGYLIQRPMDDAPQYGLVWVKNGVIYAIGGLGSDSASAIQMANSMK